MNKDSYFELGGKDLTYKIPENYEEKLNDLERRCKKIIHVNPSKGCKELLTNSKIISNMIGIEESKIARIIMRNEEDFEKLGNHQLLIRTIGVGCFYGQYYEQVRDEVFMLNENQFMLLMKLLDNDDFVDFEEKIIQEFKNERNTINKATNQKILQWSLAIFVSFLIYFIKYV